MSKGKKYKTPKRYQHKRKGFTGWKVGGGKNGKFLFRHLRRSKFFKALDIAKLSMNKLWAREMWFWD